MAKNFGVIGATIWSERLALAIVEHTSLRCDLVAEINWKGFFLLWRVFLLKAVIRVGFRPGQMRLRGIVIDIVSILFLLAKGQLIFFWTGSDVQRSANLMKDRRFITRYWSLPLMRFLMRKSTHWAAAPWLVEELKELGCVAKFLAFPTPTGRFENFDCSQRKKSNELIVLSYIPDHNFENYCGRELIEVAHRLPKINFRVMGGEGSWCEEVPPNVQFLGWTDSLDEYGNAPIVIRAVRHDALGGTVREALLCGCYVIYTYPHAHTEYIARHTIKDKLVDDVIFSLKEMQEKLDKREGRPNFEGRSWVMQNLTDKVLSKQIGDQLSRMIDA